VSTFPLYEAACAVAGEQMDVRTIIPLGSDPHVFSPNPKQVAQVSESALFVYNGAGFESWAENLKNTLPQGVTVIDMSQHVTLLEHTEEGHHEKGHAEHEQEGHNDHDHGAFDPHYWLDIDNMIRMTKKLDKEFSKIAPLKAELFHKNAAAYIVELEKLKTEFTTGLAECENRTLVSNHDAFGYLAHKNRFETVSVVGLSTDEQPSAKNIVDIVALVREHNITTVFFEALINDTVSRTIARETGAKTVSLQPLANISEDELKSHQTYLSVMRENLKKLREAMECR
jgi:zinc transport system substrate-binding protein